MRNLLLTLLVLAVAALPAVAEDAKTDIPVTRVVLFSSGVGYFEHNGTIEGDATAKLMFKTEQINDILKSMVVLDKAKDSTAIVNYASRDPLLRALKSFAVDISGNPKLSDLLKQLRGAEVIIEAPAEVSGKILGVEMRHKKVTADGTTTIFTETILNLVTPGGIRAVPMSTVGNLTLKDKKLAEELNKALALLITSHDTQRKPVEIRFKGKGKRGVSIGYIVETPVWKTSYRLVLSGDKPRLQGWAIVENTSDADWSKVELLLIGDPAAAGSRLVGAPGILPFSPFFFYLFS